MFWSGRNKPLVGATARAHPVIAATNPMPQH
jgi:hypothetical protein